MSGGLRVEGALVLSGPGARRLPVRIHGEPGRFRVELTGGPVPSPGASLELARRIGAALERSGTTVELVAGPFRVAELGRPGDPVRTSMPGAAYLLLRWALQGLPAPFRRRRR